MKNDTPCSQHPLRHCMMIKRICCKKL